MSMLKTLLAREDGPTATEYAIMLALIIVVSLAAIGLLGDQVVVVFNNIWQAL